MVKAHRDVEYRYIIDGLWLLLRAATFLIEENKWSKKRIYGAAEGVRTIVFVCSQVVHIF